MLEFSCGRTIVTIEVVGPDTVVVGSTIQVEAIAHGEMGMVTGVDFTWASSDDSIATIDLVGRVTAIKEGFVRITATAEGVAGEKTVTVVAVRAPAASVSVDGRDTLIVGETHVYTADVRDSTGNSLSLVVTWGSTDSAVAAVDSVGKVTAVQEGFAGMVATVDGVSGNKGVTVIPVPVDTVIVSGPDTMAVGEMAVFTAEPRDSAGNELDRVVTWASSESTVAVVDSAGMVTAVAVGVVGIRASSGSKAGETVTTVVPASVPVDSIVIEPRSAWLLLGDTVRLRVTAFDATGNELPDAPYAYSVVPTDIANITPDGLLTVLGAGPVTVSVVADSASDSVVYQLRSGSGMRVPALAALDSVMLAEMERLEIPGGALAVVKDERLVLARGYGLADTTTVDPVAVDALFRIGSVSKPITAAAVMRLVELGQLVLDDKPFVMLSDLPVLPGDSEDPRLADITVRHLLRHFGGWDPDRAVDARVWLAALDSLFDHQWFDPELGFRVGRGEPLAVDPGTQYGYSNYAFQTLGRVIERATGLDYVSYVQSEILNPAGVTAMQFGRTPVHERHPDEVSYYDRDRGNITGAFGVGSWPDVGGGMEYYDASGSWIGSVVDLARFITAVDGSPIRPDVLLPATVNMMVADSLGWGVYAGPTIWHTGAADGGDAFIERRADGTAYIVLFNKTRDLTTPFDFADNAIRNAVSAIFDWPTHDLFDIH